MHPVLLREVSSNLSLSFASWTVPHAQRKLMSNCSSITEFLLLAFANMRELRLLHFWLFLGIYLAALLGNGLTIMPLRATTTSTYTCTSSSSTCLFLIWAPTSPLSPKPSQFPLGHQGHLLPRMCCPGLSVSLFDLSRVFSSHCHGL